MGLRAGRGQHGIGAPGKLPEHFGGGFGTEASDGSGVFAMLLTP
jgi:hypothetical protein